MNFCGIVSDFFVAVKELIGLVVGLICLDVFALSVPLDVDTLSGAGSLNWEPAMLGCLFGVSFPEEEGPFLIFLIVSTALLESNIDLLVGLLSLL